MTVSEYKIRFCQLAHHATAIFFTKKGKVCQFISGLINLIRQSIFWVARDGALFETVVSATKRSRVNAEGEVWGP